jgi:hypothetical protein
VRNRPSNIARIAALVGAIAALALGGCGSDPSSPPVPSTWALPADPGAAAQKAGLAMLGREMLEVHYHAHVDVIVRNNRITVPAYIGIDTQRQRITALHTHDTTGIVHIESEKDIPFTLGQFFTEWGQPLTAGEIGPVAATSDEQVRVYRNGKLVSGDPAAVKFNAHDELVVWLGARNATPKVPSSFTFPEGL